MSRKKLKLFVWQGVLRDYTPGMMVALAYDVDHARQLLRESICYSVEDDLSSEPDIVTEPAAFWVAGGG